VEVRIKNDNRFIYESRKWFFVDGRGGSGKTFLFNAIIINETAMGHTAILVAWTGIAANLLRGGRTVHSTFRLPVNLNECSTSNITANNEAAYIKNAKIILWDEISMTSIHAFMPSITF
jgi:GTPase SAR1 family protein